MTVQQGIIGLLLFAGLVEHVINLFIEVTAVCVNSEEQGDSKGPNQMLQTLLDILHHLLKHVSDVVRRALQVRTLEIGTGIDTVPNNGIKLGK